MYQIYLIKYTIFENVNSADLGGIITNKDDNLLVIEHSKFDHICSTYGSKVCSGAVYKERGVITLKNDCFDYCWTTAKGNDAGGSVLAGNSSAANIYYCSATRSSPKFESTPQEAADSPLFFMYPNEVLVSQSNFSNNNGAEKNGNIFAELSRNENSTVQYRNIAVGTASSLVQYYKPKEESIIRRCNFVELIAGCIFHTYDFDLNVIESTFFGNYKGVNIGNVIFEECLSDDSRLCSSVVEFTHIPNKADEIDCSSIMDIEFCSRKERDILLVNAIFGFINILL